MLTFSRPHQQLSLGTRPRHQREVPDLPQGHYAVHQKANNPTAVLTTLVLTETLIIVPRTVTAPCSGVTRTITNYQQAPTAVVTSTGVRTVTDGQVTSYWTTTVTATASCYFPRSQSPLSLPMADAYARGSVNAVVAGPRRYQSGASDIPSLLS